MHEQNIESLRDEAIRLTSISIETLKYAMTKPDLIPATQEDQGRAITQHSMDQEIDILDGELNKLKNLEMVIAVVGTMKAGKSTIINAIVGTEVLPNRNRPMTALPTLIRHQPGQIEPLLRFNNIEPIKRLLHGIRTAMEMQNNQDELNKLIASDSDIRQLIEFIRRGESYRTNYHGAENIFHFLRSLNDLVRLSTALKIKFPFSDYSKIEQLPAIEVQFIHLQAVDQPQGRLTLLDTPGPNEAGQLHLRTMLKDQLRKSSAILAILDYTQLKSDADAELRTELTAIAEVFIDRFYVLVNKIDQSTQHSDKVEEAKNYVASQLLLGFVSNASVYPVSALWAYLANRARHELTINCKLPDADKHPWVKDFGKAALGPRWKSKISDVAEVYESVKQLWEDSMFQEPLKAVIHSAHAKAATLAMEASVVKVIDLAKRLDNLCNIRMIALSKTAEELRQQIAAIQDDLAKVGACETKAKQLTEQLHEQLTQEIQQGLQQLKESISTALEDYFKQGKLRERQEYEDNLRVEAERDKKNSRWLIGAHIEVVVTTMVDAWSEMLGRWEGKSDSGSPPKQQPHNRKPDFNPDTNIMTFSSSREAQEQIKKINQSIDSVFSSGEETLIQAMNVTINQFQQDFTRTILKQAQETLNEIAKRLSKSGFDLHLDLPKESSLSLGISGSDLLMDTISERTKTETKSRHKNTWWGGVCSFFGTKKWGRETYDETTRYYEINLIDIHKLARLSVKQAFANLETAVTQQIEAPISKVINAFFKEFKEKIEEIRSNLIQGEKDKQRDQDTQRELVNDLSSLKKNIKTILKDAQALQQDTKEKLNIAKPQEDDTAKPA